MLVKGMKETGGNEVGTWRPESLVWERLHPAAPLYLLWNLLSAWLTGVWSASFCVSMSYRSWLAASMPRLRLLHRPHYCPGYLFTSYVFDLLLHFKTSDLCQ